MKNIGSARYARERETRGNFTIVCLPPSRSSRFFRAILIFHAPATQVRIYRDFRVSLLTLTLSLPTRELLKFFLLCYPSKLVLKYTHQYNLSETVISQFCVSLCIPLQYKLFISRTELMCVSFFIVRVTRHFIWLPCMVIIML